MDMGLIRDLVLTGTGTGLGLIFNNPDILTITRLVLQGKTGGELGYADPYESIKKYCN